MTHHTVAAIATAVTWLWLGMVLAISFIEAPLKFRVPGLELRVGLGIGRLVFRALNSVEVVWAVVLAVCLALGGPTATTTVAVVAAVVLLVAQLAGVRPLLNRRSDRVLAGEEGPRSHAHLWYVGLEVLKVAALVVAGVALS
jgi:hypothetical protein